MCGIAGFIGAGDRDVLDAMCDSLAHRGPDGSGRWHDLDADRPVWLGFRRLVVLDPEGGAQPMCVDGDRLVIVYNGEIYDSDLLRRELEATGVRFRSDHSDTEVLLRAYDHWGPSVVARLSGMFAFAIFDRDKQRLFFARDRFGKKPLYYSQTRDGLVFGSELTALIHHPEVDRTWCRISLARYFALGFLPAPHTLYRSIRKLPGGHSMTYDLRTGHLEIERFWEYRIRPSDPPPGDPDDWAEELRELMDRAVRRRLRADVALGFFLSGGVDSTAILAFAARHLDSSKLLTFNVGFKEPSFDESSFARKAAAHYGAQHNETTLDLGVARDLLPNVLERMDDPIADGSLLPTYLLSRFAREKLTVALCGDGGDELFAGYDPFRALSFAKFYNSVVPGFLHRMARELVERLPVSDRNMSLDFKLRNALKGMSYREELWNPVWLAPIDPRDLEFLFEDGFSIEEIYADVIESWGRCDSPNLVDRTLEYYARFYLSGNLLTKMDRASMQCSLEVRSPFLDNDLVDFVVRLPADVKLRLGSRKWLLKKSLARLVPDYILDRPKKGFGVPMASWLKRWPRPNFSLTYDLGLNTTFLEKCWREHQSGVADHRGLLWAWITIEKHADGMPS